ncbi:MAG: alpha/beta fold hydrolase [Anaerolineaceae bacterium]
MTGIQQPWTKWLTLGVMLTGLWLLSACAPFPLARIEPQNRIELEDCLLGAPGMTHQQRGRCGMLPVPEDRSRPDGRQINLNIAVIPAAIQNKEPDPLFLLAGGPGQAASEVFIPLLPIFDAINFRRDLVLIDQRGAGRSNPLTCPELADTEVQRVGEDLPVEDQQAHLEACLAALDADTRFYTTPAAAADLDDVRQALGYEQINLLGVSYGTRLAQVYLHLYPDRVRTMVLNGVVPQGWAIGGASMAADAERALGIIFERCQADPACNLAFPDLKDHFREWLARLDENPAAITIEHPLTGKSTEVWVTRYLVSATVRLMTYSSDYVALLPYLIYTAAVDGDYQPLIAQYFIALEPASGGINSGLFLSVLCSEDVPFYPSDMNGAGYFFQPPMESFRSFCEIWPHEIIDPLLRQPVQSNVPTLLLSGEADPVTPPVNADRVAAYLPNSLNLVAPGLGHDVIHQGCVPRIIYQFIDRGEVDSLSVDCVRQLLPFPFFTSPLGPQP